MTDVCDDTAVEIRRNGGVAVPASASLPAVIVDAGERASRRFVEFFTANIRNRNTRGAYAHAIGLFLDWCGMQRCGLVDLEPFIVAAYIEQLMSQRSSPTVKQHLAAIRMLMDWLVLGRVIPFNPAASVRGPRHVVKKGKTLVLSPEQARGLIDSIDTATLIGLRDRALPAYPLVHHRVQGVELPPNPFSNRRVLHQSS